jgi:GTP-binding protein EngB required for normal cell division
VPRLLGEIAAVAAELGDADSAARVRDEAGTVTALPARVVVVGEKKRGKSSLINALLRRTDNLLPVEVDIATSVHITVFYADAEQALVIDETHPTGMPIRLAEIGDYAALERSTKEMRHFGVREVSVGLPDPLLRTGIDLIDTPGVGGLVSGHAALTLAALSMADALLFVVNGSTELTKSECEFLARATERIATVVFVLTQIDKYPKWRETLDLDQALIEKHAPRFADCPWYAVSSEYRLDALRQAADGRQERAAMREQRSGFGPLEAELTSRIAGHAAELRAQNATFVARRVLEKLTADQEERLRSLAKDPSLIATIRARKAALDDAARSDATWRRDLDRSFRKLGKESTEFYQRGLIDLQVTSDRWAAEADTSTATQIAHDFDAGLRAVWTDVEGRTREGALAIAGYLASTLGAEGIDALDADMPYPEQLAARNLLLTSEPQAGGLSGRLSRLMPGLSGVSMASMLGHLLFASVNPFAILGIGGVVAGMLNSGNQERAARARVRADVQRHIQSVASQARFEFGVALDKLTETLRAQLTDTIEERMGMRLRELTAAIADANRHLEESEQVLAPQRAECEQALGRLRALSARAGRLAPTSASASLGPA